MKIYISGKITGLPIEDAKAMFQAAEDFLNKKHLDANLHFPLECINPFKLNHDKIEEMEQAPPGKYSTHDKWCQYMKEDLAALLNCDGIYMLKNWGASQGARIEHVVAKEMGLTVEYEQ